MGDESHLRLRPPQPLGKICISQLQTWGVCGIHNWEQQVPQPLSVDGEFTYAIGDCVISDAMADAVDYEALVDHVKKFLNNHSFALLETLVFSLCHSVLTAFPRLLSAHLFVRKLLACQGLAPTVALSLSRSMVILGLGSNLGDRLANLHTAHAAIAVIPRTKLRAASSIHQTEPLLVREQPEFLNQCLLVETTLPPLELLAHTQSIEHRFDERRGPAKGPRQLDIDLLLFEGVSCRSQQLSLPHPAVQKRRFWLEELAELGIHFPPANGAVMQQLCEIFIPKG